MFRENETRYLIASAALVWIISGLLAWYEIGYNEEDSQLDTAVAIAQGVATAVALTIAILASIEVFMVFAERYRQRRYQEGLREGKQRAYEEWEAWNERRLQAEANGEPFDEAPPSQLQSDSEPNGRKA